MAYLNKVQGEKWEKGILIFINDKELLNKFIWDQDFLSATVDLRPTFWSCKK